MEIKDKPLMNDISTVCRFPIPVDGFINTNEPTSTEVDVLKEVLNTFYNVEVKQTSEGYKLVNPNYNWFCKHLELQTDGDADIPVVEITTCLKQWRNAEMLASSIIGGVSRGGLLAIIEGSLDASISYGLELMEIVSKDAKKFKQTTNVNVLKCLGLEYTQHGCFIICDEAVLENEFISSQLKTGELLTYNLNDPTAPISVIIRSAGDIKINEFIDKLIYELEK